jgi:glycosyltransferase involved in cell wall biosynthesis
MAGKGDGGATAPAKGQSAEAGKRLPDTGAGAREVASSALLTGSEARPEVSVVATVLNEAGSVRDLVTSIRDQTLPPDEIVIVDGGSTDGTWETLRELASDANLPPVRAISRPGANISLGRNVAIDAARGPWIAVTDAGVTLDDKWLARLVGPLQAGRSLAAGFFVADAHGAFQTALGATTLPHAEDVDNGFLPSSRSAAFLKQVWVDCGGYPEWLDYCEDLVFDIRAEAAAGGWTFVPGAVAHFRPRASLGAFVRQYYLYARGDGKAGLWPKRHAIRYGTYLVAGPALLALAVGARKPLATATLAAGAGAILVQPYRRLGRMWGPLETPERLRAAAWVPAIRIAGDLAKMAGYPAGVVWRWRNRPPEWRPKVEAGSLS